MTRQSAKPIIQMFIDTGREITAMTEAARWGELEMLRDLLGKGIPVDATEEGGCTALMLAASSGETSILRYLIDKGANVNAVDTEKGWNAIISCVRALHNEETYIAIVQQLLDAGANPNIRDFSGKTALDYAKERKSARLVGLLERGMRQQASDDP